MSRYKLHIESTRAVASHLVCHLVASKAEILASYVKCFRIHRK